MSNNTNQKEPCGQSQQHLNNNDTKQTLCTQHTSNIANFATNIVSSPPGGIGDRLCVLSELLRRFFHHNAENTRQNGKFHGEYAYHFWN